MVAAGRYDGYWEQSLQSWDVAAGILLVREAGGQVTDYDGAENAISDDHLIASNGLIHAAMVDLLRGRYRV
jgi:myo-inositol-1(or 4)-monophosphatase